MRIGVDFGTTRIVVAAVDRGNYPLVHFETPDGQTRDWFPPVVAVKDGVRIYGWDAIAVQDQESWTVVRSLKRALRSAGPYTEVHVAGQPVPLRVLMAEMMRALHTQLVEHSNLGAKKGEVLEAMLGVPANAHSNQRFLTEEAARTAGFKVLGVVNEPSAAAIEFGYRSSEEHREQMGSGLLVYDLGGGTFDVSLVTLREGENIVEASDGIPNLGGDDFDEILANIAVVIATPHPPFTPFERRRLLDECREKKESLNPNTRKVTIDFERVRPGLKEVTIPVDVYYERCRPLIEQTRKMVEDLLARHTDSRLDMLYVTGGGSELPAVARVLRECFGRKVRRSAYMRSASAVGLAIRAAAAAGQLHDQFTHNFGIWREADSGGTIVFDLIFPRGARLPAPDEPPLRLDRTYQPAHNVGHFRYLECSQLNEDGQPVGEITNWEQIQFPFDPALWGRSDLAREPVRPLAMPNGLTVHEEYSCDSNGKLRVRISQSPTGHECEYQIGQLMTN
jgi:molecular chaperone DnaK (HSP70)